MADSLLHFAVTFIVMFVASVFQAAIGFGFGLVSVICLTILDYPIDQVVLVTASCCLLQVMPLAIRQRSAVQWSRYRWLFTALCASTLLGAAALWFLVKGVHGSFANIMFCTVLLAAVVIQLVSGRTSRPFVGPRWGLAAMSVGGVMGGISATPGPPIALWVVSQNWTLENQRTFLWTSFSICYPIVIAMLIIQQNQSVWLLLLMSLLAWPGIYIGTKLGVHIGRRIDSAKLYWIGLLTLAIGASIPLVRLAIQLPDSGWK